MPVGWDSCGKSFSSDAPSTSWSNTVSFSMRAIFFVCDRLYSLSDLMTLYSLRCLIIVTSAFNSIWFIVLCRFFLSISVFVFNCKKLIKTVFHDANAHWLSAAYRCLSHSTQTIENTTVWKTSVTYIYSKYDFFLECRVSLTSTPIWGHNVLDKNNDYNQMNNFFEIICARLNHEIRSPCLAAFSTVITVYIKYSHQLYSRFGL